MEDNRKFNPRWANVYIGTARFGLMFTFVIVATIAVTWLGVALSGELTTSVRVMMWSTSLFFALIGLDGWGCSGDKNKLPLWQRLSFMVIAVGEIPGIYIPTLTAPVLWVNTALWVIFLVAIAPVFPKLWKIASAMPAKS